MFLDEKAVVVAQLVSLPSLSILHSLCRSLADAGETRSRRVSSSPSWSSVSLIRASGRPVYPANAHGRLLRGSRPRVHTSPSSRYLRCTRCIGASGTGRTTFVNTLCESEVLPHKVCDSPETAHVEEGIRIKPVNVGTFALHAPQPQRSERV